MKIYNHQLSTIDSYQSEEKTTGSGDESDGDGSAYNSSSEGTGGGLAASGGSSVADIDAFADSLGVACVVCKSFDVQTGNTLVECQDCHSLYHQDCHRWVEGRVDVMGTGL